MEQTTKQETTAVDAPRKVKAAYMELVILYEDGEKEMLTFRFDEMQLTQTKRVGSLNVLLTGKEACYLDLLAPPLPKGGV